MMVADRCHGGSGARGREHGLRARPIRAIPTGRARRPRCRRSRSPPCGPARRSTMSRTNGRTTPRSARWWPGCRRATPLDEAEKAIKEFLAASASDKADERKAPVRRPVRHAQRPALLGHERARARDAQAARGRREDPRRHARSCRRCRARRRATSTKIDELGNQLVWETRIFEDRRQVVKFVCEVPTAIDQRLFALGRTIQQEME